MIRYNKINGLGQDGLTRFFVYALAVWLVPIQFVYGLEEHVKGSGLGSRPIPGSSNPRGSEPVSSEEVKTCTVAPNQLIDFANGTNYSYPAMAQWLTSPICAENGNRIRRTATAQILLDGTFPFRFSNLIAGLDLTEPESVGQIDARLSSQIPSVLETYPMNREQLLQLTGKLAVLSRDAARSSLSEVIVRDLRAMDERKAKAEEMASTLRTMGIAETSILSKVVGKIGRDADFAYAEALTKELRSLGLAAAYDNALTEGFNASAERVKKSVVANKAMYLPEQRVRMLQAIFEAVRVAVAGTEALEPGAIELNQAMEALLRGDSLKDTVLIAVWKEVTNTLSNSYSQAALAEAFAASLKPMMVFVVPTDVDRIFKAADHYPAISAAIQTNFLVAWEYAMRKKKTSVEIADLKRRFFEPLSQKILALGPEHLNSYWLSQAVQHGFISDEHVEKLFPILVLRTLQDQQKHDAIARSDGHAVGQVVASTSAAGTAWALYHAHIPSLFAWVDKHESH